MTPVPGRSDIEQFRTIVTCHLGLQYEDGKLDYLADVIRQRMQSVGRGHARMPSVAPETRGLHIGFLAQSDEPDPAPASCVTKPRSTHP